MRHPFIVLPLAAALLSSGATATAGEYYTLSDASLAASAVVVLLPLSVVVAGSTVVSGVVEEISTHKRWHVTEVKPEGQNTAVRMCSDDAKAKLTMQVPTATARSHGLQVNDTLDMEPVGKAGFLVRKGGAAVGVLSDPAAGMIHSKARG